MNDVKLNKCEFLGKENMREGNIPGRIMNRHRTHLLTNSRGVVLCRYRIIGAKRRFIVVVANRKCSVDARRCRL